MVVFIYLKVPEGRVFESFTWEDSLHSKKDPEKL